MKIVMKRLLAGLVVLSLSLCLLSGCKSEPADELASSEEFYEEETRGEVSKEDPSEEKQEEQKPSKPDAEEKPDTPVENKPEEKPDTPVENKPEEKPAEKEPAEEKPETPKEEEPPAEEQEAEEEAAEQDKKPEFSMDKALKVATFNIKNAMGGKSIDQIAGMLKELDADLIGLQEVDCNAPRSGNVNQVQRIAEKAGYSYFYFTPCIVIGDNHTPYTGETNASGHAIISKHPILKSEVIWPREQAEFGLRNFSRHEIDINGKTVAFYNCHLDFTKGRYQYEEIQDNYMMKDRYAICVGDFNETMDEMFLQFDYENFHCLAFGEEMENPWTNASGKQPIDHIVVSKHTVSWYDEEVKNGYYDVPHNGASDHNLKYGYFNLLD